MSLGFKSQSVGVRANLCDDRTVDIWSMYSRTLLDILFLIWGQTVADYKILSFHLSINVIIIVVSFKILDLCPIALFQQLWNTLYNLLVTHDEDLQFLIEIVTEHRRAFPDSGKSSLLTEQQWVGWYPRYLCLQRGDPDINKSVYL